MQTANDIGQPAPGAPPKQGLYDPQFEHDSCGIGFVVNMKGRKSHQLVTDGLQILMNLDHRGAVGCEPNTGDGAGILIQTPHEFLVKATAKLGFKLPASGEYGVGMLFLPQNPLERNAVKTAFAKIVSAEGQTLLGWRDVPTDNSSLGKTAVAAEPFMAQVFIGRNPALKDEAAFERKLYVIRKLAEQKIRYGNKIDGGKWFYVSSLVGADDDLQGHVDAGTGGEILSRLARREHGHGAGAGAFAFFHEHVSELGPRASEPLHRAQRRNQHAARQHQLDEGGAGEFQVRAVRQRHQESHSRHQRGRQRLRAV